MNPAWASVLLATLLAWAGSLAAVLLGQAGSRYLRPFVYLSLLFFAAVAIFDILPESKQALSWPVFVTAVAAGYGAFWAIGTFVFPICPTCAMRRFESGHHHVHGSGLLIFAAVLGVHCFIDGFGISAASTVETAFGLRVLAAIAVHKLPEGFAVALVLMAGSRSARQAFQWALGIEVATLLGAVASALWTHPSEFWQAVVLANVGGTFLYLSFSGLRDLLAPPVALVVPGPMTTGQEISAAPASLRTEN
jgi:zinc transporter ZupT